MMSRLRARKVQAGAVMGYRECRRLPASHHRRDGDEPRDVLDHDSLFAASTSSLPSQPAQAGRRGKSVEQAAIIPDLTSGEIQLADGWPAAAKSKIVRAAKRARIQSARVGRSSSEWFERTEVAAAEDVA